MQTRFTPNGFPYTPSTAAKVLRKVVKDIEIDSRDYVSRGTCAGSSIDGQFVVHLPNTYKSVYSAQITKIALPYTFNEIQSTDTLNIITVGGTGFTGNVSVPAGAYTLADLLTALDTAIETATARGYTLTSNHGVVTITANTGGDTIQITGGTLASYLGFTAPTAAAISITGTCPANPRPVSYLLMEIDLLNQVDETQLLNTPGGAQRKSGSTDSVFTKIDLIGAKGDYIYLSEKSFSFSKTICNPPLGKLQSLHVKFRTHDGRVVDFCGVPVSFTLQLELLDNNFDEFSSMETTPMR
jgi:hypothetical protein